MDSDTTDTEESYPRLPTTATTKPMTQANFIIATASRINDSPRSLINKTVRTCPSLQQGGCTITTVPAAVFITPSPAANSDKCFQENKEGSKSSVISNQEEEEEKQDLDRSSPGQGVADYCNLNNNSKLEGSSFHNITPEQRRYQRVARKSVRPPMSLEAAQTMKAPNGFTYTHDSVSSTSTFIFHQPDDNHHTVDDPSSTGLRLREEYDKSATPEYTLIGNNSEQPNSSIKEGRVVTTESNGVEWWSVEKILRHRIKPAKKKAKKSKNGCHQSRSSYQFQVQWANWDQDDLTWYPADQLTEWGIREYFTEIGEEIPEPFKEVAGTQYFFVDEVLSASCDIHKNFAATTTTNHHQILNKEANASSENSRNYGQSPTTQHENHIQPDSSTEKCCVPVKKVVQYREVETNRDPEAPFRLEFIVGWKSDNTMVIDPNWYPEDDVPENLRIEYFAGLQERARKTRERRERAQTEKSSTTTRTTSPARRSTSTANRRLRYSPTKPPVSKARSSTEKQAKIRRIQNGKGELDFVFVDDRTDVGDSLQEKAMQYARKRKDSFTDDMENNRRVEKASANKQTRNDREGRDQDHLHCSIMELSVKKMGGCPACKKEFATSLGGGCPYMSQGCGHSVCGVCLFQSKKQAEENQRAMGDTKDIFWWPCPVPGCGTQKAFRFLPAASINLSLIGVLSNLQELCKPTNGDNSIVEKNRVHRSTLEQYVMKMAQCPACNSDFSSFFTSQQCPYMSQGCGHSVCGACLFKSKKQTEQHHQQHIRGDVCWLPCPVEECGTKEAFSASQTPCINLGLIGVLAHLKGLYKPQCCD